MGGDRLREEVTHTWRFDCIDFVQNILQTRKLINYTILDIFRGKSLPKPLEIGTSDLMLSKLYVKYVSHGILYLITALYCILLLLFSKGAN